MKRILILLLFISTFGLMGCYDTKPSNNGYSRTNSALAWTVESGSEGTPTYLSQSQKYGISIKTPSIVHNPNLVPFTFKLASPINKNSMLDVYSNGSLAYRIVPRENVEIISLGGRVRTTQAESVITVKVSSFDSVTAEPGETLETKSARYKATSIATIPLTNNNNRKYDSWFYNGEFKVNFYNNMGDLYVIGFDIKTPKGMIYTSITPTASGYGGNKYSKGYLGIKGNFNSGTIEKVRLK